VDVGLGQRDVLRDKIAEDDAAAVAEAVAADRAAAAKAERAERQWRDDLLAGRGSEHD
jgi:hypothetical protein